MVENPELTMRVPRSEWRRLVWAFVISIVLHGAIYGGYEAGQKYGLWQLIHLPHWLTSTKLLAGLLKQQEPPKEPETEIEVPLVFVDVSSAQATPEPPKESAFYSDKNSKAANPDTKAATDMPKIDGKQTDIVKTEDVPREKAFPLQPAIVPQPARPEPEEVKPKPADKPGELALAKPSEMPQKDPAGKQDEPPKPGKPRTIKEALARLATTDTRPGQKMKQDGGVRRHGLSSTLDVTATTFGAYDAKVIAAVQNRWDDLLENRLYARDRFGKVTVRFRLHADGTVTEMTFLENTVDLSLALLCQSAIRDTAPYEPWPSDMKRKIGAEYREVSFTFFYN